MHTHVPPAVPSPPPSSSQYPPPLRPSKPPQPPASVPVAAKMAASEKAQWLFEDYEVETTPSVADGITIVEERARRAKGVNFIIQAGIILKLPQLTLATASVFFHRFYMRYSMVPEKGGIHHYNIAATALFLATKTEENCRKTKEIVIAVAKVAQKNTSLIIDEQSKEFWRWKDSILAYEELMLELLTFDVVLESPYMHLYESLKVLELEGNKSLRNVAWAFLNDSCMTMLALMMPARQVAVAALYFSARFNHERIPDDNARQPWWVKIGGIPANMTKAVDVMFQFYTENPLKRNDNPYDRSPNSRGNDVNDTRLRAEGAESPTPGERAEELERMASRSGANYGNGHGNGNGHGPRDAPGSLRDDSDADRMVEDDGDEGFSDAKLKMSANDLAAREAVARGEETHFNGVAKRKNDYGSPQHDEDEVSRPKRSRIGSGEESEEGEVEE